MNPLFNPGLLFIILSIVLAHRAHRRSIEQYYANQLTPGAPHPRNILLNVARFFMYFAMLATGYQIILAFFTGTFCDIPIRHFFYHF